MRFIVYPTAGDRAQQVNGQVKQGDRISAAAPSGQWVYVLGEGFYRVFGREHQAGAEWLRSAIETERR